MEDGLVIGDVHTDVHWYCSDHFDGKGDEMIMRSAEKVFGRLSFQDGVEFGPIEHEYSDVTELDRLRAGSENCLGARFRYPLYNRALTSKATVVGLLQ